MGITTCLSVDVALFHCLAKAINHFRPIDAAVLSSKSKKEVIHVFQESEERYQQRFFSEPHWARPRNFETLTHSKRLYALFVIKVDNVSVQRKT